MAGQNFKIGVDDKEALDAFTKLEKDARMFESTMVKLGDKIDNVFEATNLKEYKQAISSQISVVESLTKEYDNLVAKRDEWASKGVGKTFTNEEIKQQQAEYANFEKQLKRIDRELQSETKELEKQQISLQLIEKEYDKVSSKSVTYLTQLKNIREEMATMVDASGNVSTKDIDRYNELKGKLGELGTAYRRVQQEQKLVTQAGSSMVLGITQGLQAIAGTFTLIQGLSSLISSDSEDVAEAQKKLQQAMAITMGIQQVSTALHSTSALRLGLVAKATNLLTIAQNRLAIAFNGSTVAARAFMGAVTLGIGVAITAAIAAYNKYADAQEKAAQAAKELNEEYKGQYSSVSKQIVTLRELQIGWVALGDNVKAQKQYLIDNAKAFEDFGIEANNVNKANDLLTKDTDRYIEGLKLRAKATANMALAEKAWVEVQSLRDSAKTRKAEANWLDSTKAFFAKIGLRDAAKYGTVTQEEIDSITGLSFAEKAGEEMEEQAKTQEQKFEEYINNMLGLQKEADSLLGDYTPKDEKSKDKDADNDKKELDKLLLDQDRALEAQYIKFEKEKLEIEKLGVEDRLKLIEIERNERIASIEKEKKDLKEKYEKVDTEIFDKRIQQTKEFFDKKRQIEIENTDKLNAERLSKFASYSQREQKIREEYENLRKLAQKDKTIDVSLIDKAELEDLKELKDEFNKDAVRTAQEIAIILGDISVMTAKELRDAIDKVNKELSKGITDPKELEAWQNQLEKLTSELKGKSPFMAFEQEVKNAVERMKKGDMSDIGAGIMAIGNATKDVIPELKELSSTIGNIFGQGAQSEVDGFIETLETLAEVGTGVGKVMAGDVVGGSLDLFNSIGGIIGKFKAINEEHKEALRLLKRQEENLKVQYAILVMQKNIAESKNSIFGSDLYGSALISLREYNNALKLTHELLKGDRAPKNKYFFGQIINTKEIEAYKKDLLGLYDIKIVTGSRKSGWGFWKKQKDVYDSVLNVYDDLIDAEGRLNIARAESILQNRKMSDSDKEKFQNMIDSAKQAEAAYAEVEAYFSNIFGNLSNDLMDSVIEAFSKGESELHKFGNSAENMLKKLASDMVYYLAFSDIMEDAEKKIKKIGDSDLTEEEKLVKYSDAISDLNSNINNRLDYANSLLEMAEKVTGIDFSSDMEAPKASKGYQVTASQDSVDEVLGIARNMQMVGLNQEQELIKQTEILSTFGNGFISMQQELQGITSITLESMYYLRDIEKHTKTLNGFGEILTKIEKNTQ